MEIPSPTAKALAAPPSRARSFLDWFKPDEAAAVIAPDNAETRAKFCHWQTQILIASLIGYASFYFVRKNLSLAMPAMEASGISKVQLGTFLTLHGVIYGISKFINGFLGDRTNARTFMFTGLATCALLNVFFGASSSVTTLGVIWMLNGWFQGMGFPPCARLMTHWFSPKEIVTKMSIWNSSHSIGAGLISVLCGYLVMIHWRLCFWVPAVLAFATAVYLLFSLRDTPQSLGLPDVEGTEESESKKNERSKESFATILWQYVFSNPAIWVFSIANFFVYTIRYSVFDWGPTLLSQTKGFKLSHAGWTMFGFEVSGLVGALIAGWATAKFFGGRGARTSVIYMALSAVSLLLFWKIPNQSAALSTTLLCLTGFFIYGPQALVGITTANLGTKKAAASAVGLTGLFGYASTTASGVGLALLAQKLGWDAVFGCLIIVAIIGMLLFAVIWGAKPHGYDHDS